MFEELLQCKLSRFEHCWCSLWCILHYWWMFTIFSFSFVCFRSHCDV